MKPKISRREEIKISLDINEIEKSGTIENNSVKPKVGSLVSSVKWMVLQPDPNRKVEGEALSGMR